jgi:hypothetical protein
MSGICSCAWPHMLVMPCHVAACRHARAPPADGAAGAVSRAGQREAMHIGGTQPTLPNVPVTMPAGVLQAVMMVGMMGCWFVQQPAWAPTTTSHNCAWAGVRARPLLPGLALLNLVTKYSTAYDVQHLHMSEQHVLRPAFEKSLQDRRALCQQSTYTYTAHAQHSTGQPGAMTGANSGRSTPAGLPVQCLQAWQGGCTAPPMLDQSRC